MSDDLLRLSGATIEAAGATLAASLSLVAPGPRVVVVGDAAALLGPLLGVARVTEGTFEVAGAPVDDVRGELGLAPFEVVLPPEATPLSYVTWSARLAGLSKADAESAARLSCAKATMGDLLMRPLRTLGPVPRRLTILAHAAVAPARLLVFESPLSGLDPAAAGFVLAAIGRLVGGSNALVSTPRFEATSAGETLARGASQVVVLAGGKVIEQGPPAAIRTLWPVSDPPADVVVAPT